MSQVNQFGRSSCTKYLRYFGWFSPKKSRKRTKKPMPNSQISTRYWARDIFGFLDIYDFLRNILWKMLTLPHGKWGKSGYNTKIYKSFWRTRFINEISQNFIIAEKVPKVLPPIFQILNAKKQCQSEKGQKTNTNPPISLPPPILAREMLCNHSFSDKTIKRLYTISAFDIEIWDTEYWLLIWKWFSGSWKVLLTIPTCHELGMLEGCIPDA